jgi:DNA-binding transcriptional LysR family regulator
MELITPDAAALEGFYYFAQVVEHEGFARAARALAIPRSRLSRHVQRLEIQLGVRLVNRSTRRFVVTDVGREVHRHATAMLAEAAAALEAVEVAQVAPRGTIRVSCPVALAQWSLAVILPDFLARYPAVRLHLQVSNRRVDVLSEGVDVALRVRAQPSGEDGLVMRAFGKFEELLVASPAYLERSGPITEPEQLGTLATLDYAADLERLPWELSGPQGRRASIAQVPRVACHDFVVLRALALAAAGVARLPESVVREDIRAGRVLRVLPGWHSPLGVLHAVFPTRRGLLPAVRAFIDFLAERLPATL